MNSCEADIHFIPFIYYYYHVLCMHFLGEMCINEPMILMQHHTYMNSCEQIKALHIVDARVWFEDNCLKLMLAYSIRVWFEDNCLKLMLILCSNSRRHSDRDNNKSVIIY
jgi:hypothetical protein